MSDPRDDGTVEALLRLAGRGPEPSTDGTVRARGAVRAAWRDAVGRRRRRRVFLLGGSLVAAGLAWMALRPGPAPPPAPPPVVVATVERAPSGASLPVGHTLASGASVETGPFRLALRTAAGASLRLDTGTRLLFTSAMRVSLAAGALYFDSGPSRPGFVLDTPRGRVTDEGTLFEARVVDGSSLRLRVREGRVRLGLAVAEAGEELRAGAAALERGRVAVASAEWAWAEALAVPPPIDGRPLVSILEWAARQRGLGLRFHDEATRARAGRVLLRGSVSDLTPAEALDAVTITSGLDARVDGGALLVEGAR